jgi:hypothetical protein
MEEVKVLYLANGQSQPDNFTGVAIWDGTKIWFRNGLISRLDGPAIEHSSGHVEWWLGDWELSFEQYWWHQKDTIHASKIMAYMLGAKR